jgi:ribonuclease P protein component
MVAVNLFFDLLPAILFPFLRSRFNEKDLPAFPRPSQKNAWVFGAHENQRWTKSFECKAGQRQAKIGSFSTRLNFCFQHKQRLGSKKEFQALFSKGRRFQGNRMDVIVLQNALGYPRFGVIVGRKQAKKAVYRNAAKRQMREAFRLTAPPGVAADIIVRIKRHFSKEELKPMRLECETLLQKVYPCYNASVSA